MCTVLYIQLRAENMKEFFFLFFSFIYFCSLINWLRTNFHRTYVYIMDFQIQLEYIFHDVFSVLPFSKQYNTRNVFLKAQALPMIRLMESVIFTATFHLVSRIVVRTARFSSNFTSLWYKYFLRNYGEILIFRHQHQQW